MAPDPTSLVYRLRGLPSYIDSHVKAIELLSWALGQEQRVLGIQVCSLATITVSSWTVTTKTATIMFREMPRVVQDSPNQDEWTIVHLRLPSALLLDSHFRGMTPLNDVLPPHEHKHNCIAISGLSSHPFGSWQPRGGRKEFMWLRDELPRHQPTMRVWTYGYDTNLINSTSFQSISDLSISLINHLEASDFASPMAPQILVMAHSLGGIVFKEAISILGRGEKRHIHILSLIKGSLLFGVPNSGMEQSHLYKLVRNQPNQSLVKHLALRSPYLIDLDTRFLAHRLNHKMNVIWAYETCTSEIFETDQDGNIRPSATRRILVSKESATSNLISHNPNLTIPINKDHSSIVKYHKDDEDSSRVMLKIREIVESMTVPPSQTPGASAGLTTSGLSDGEMLDSLPLDMLWPFLNAAELSQRHEGIEIRSLYTFEWIFENDDLAFTKWLRSEEKMYWIQGKPGSGKSTLMKFIYDDPRTCALLSTWKKTDPSIIASFFFHHRGSVLQKSLDGLLRSILTQILQQQPRLSSVLSSTIEELFRVKFPLRKRELETKLKEHIWKQNELWKMLHHILGQKSGNLDICFFFDALDEYDGSPEILKDLLNDMCEASSAGKTKLKICFSSRPWQCFTDSFSENLGFSIDKHTIDDIQMYCYQMLEDHKTAANLIGPLVPEITRNASGVFLWARLALADLIEEAGSMMEAYGRTTRTEVLRERLNALPRELEDYYEEIVKRCHRSLRMKAYVLLEVVTRSDRILTLSELMLALACFKSPTFDDCQDAIINGAAEAVDQHRARKLVSNACGGLLECKSIYVQLMHQTVREFVLSPKFKNLLLGTAAEYQHENGHSFLAKFGLTQRQIAFNQAAQAPLPSLDHIKTNVKYHLKEAEMTTGKTQLKFLISLDPAPLSVLLDATDGDVPLYDEHAILAIQADLHLCLEEMAAKRYLTDQEKDVAIIYYLNFRCSKYSARRADSTNLRSLLNALGFKPQDIFSKLVCNNNLQLISKHPVIGLASFFENEDKKIEVSTLSSAKGKLSHHAQSLIHRPSNIVHVDEGALKLVQDLLDREVDLDSNYFTPFQSGAMIYNPSFITWVLRRASSRGVPISWSRGFIDSAVAFWCAAVANETNYLVTLALGESIFIILDELASDEDLDGGDLVTTNSAAWNSVRRNLRDMKRHYERDARSEKLLARNQLEQRLEKWYHIGSNTPAADGAREAPRMTQLSKGKSISVFGKTLRARIKTVFNPSQSG